MNIFNSGWYYFDRLAKTLKNYFDISMKKSSSLSAFTLIEVLVSLTILSIMMVSIMMIFSVSTQIALKTDINRALQQNMKSMVETIAEDVRKGEIVWVRTQYPDDYGPLTSPWTKHWFHLKVWDNEYVLYSFAPTVGKKLSDAAIVSNITDCQDMKNVCVLYKKSQVWPSLVEIGPLSNSTMSITALDYYFTKWDIPKLTITMTVRPAIKSGLYSSLIQNATLDFQTTVSQRYLQVK